MLREMARVVRPRRDRRDLRRGHPPVRVMREEHHDVWLGFSEEQVDAFFTAAGLGAPSLEVLGRQ